MDPVERIHIIETLKKRIRKNNWNYLCRHKEVRAIIRFILSEVIKEQPEDIYNFVAGLFHCDNIEILTKEVNAQLERVSALIKNSAWTEYDGDMLFPVTSTLNACEEGSAIDSILKFSLAEKDVEIEEVESENVSSDSIISVKQLMNDDLI